MGGAQLREGGSRDIVGLKEENLLQILFDMEIQLGELTDKVCWLKWCVKLKGEVGLGLGLGQGRGVFVEEPRDRASTQPNEPIGNAMQKGEGKIQGQEDGLQPKGRGLAQNKLGPVWRTQAESGPSVGGAVPLFLARTLATLQEVVVPPVEATTLAVTSIVHCAFRRCNNDVVFAPNASEPTQKGAIVVAGTSTTSK